MLVYALIYAGTGADNSTNVLGPQVVRMVNEFTGKKCAEVRKEQLQEPRRLRFRLSVRHSSGAVVMLLQQP